MFAEAREPSTRPVDDAFEGTFRTPDGTIARTAVSCSADGGCCGAPREPAAVSASPRPFENVGRCWTSYVLAEDDITYSCVCNAADNEDMVVCDGCDRWFHFRCAGFADLTEVPSGDDPFFCEQCRPPSATGDGSAAPLGDDDDESIGAAAPPAMDDDAAPTPALPPSPTPTPMPMSDEDAAPTPAPREDTIAAPTEDEPMGPRVDDEESTPALPLSPTPTPMSDEDEDEATAPSEADGDLAPRFPSMNLECMREADAAALYPGDWERRCRGCYPVFGGVVGYYEEGQGGHICQTCEYDL